MGLRVPHGLERAEAQLLLVVEARVVDTPHVLRFERFIILLQQPVNCSDHPNNLFLCNLHPATHRVDSYAELKAAVVDAVVTVLAPIQVRYAELAADPRGLRKVLSAGAEKARGRAAATVTRARRAMGLLPA